jgi:hypothetical protein
VVHAVTALRALVRRHGWLRYLQIIPVGLALWGTDAIDRFRAGAQAAGLAHAAVVNTVSVQLGGRLAMVMNQWLASHPVAASTAAWYYVVLQGTITGVAGLALIWRRAPNFSVHRNALIACNIIGLAAFWCYPVAPPRMLPGYHDVTAAAVPVFSSVLEGKAADLFASLPSLHVAWALWVAVAADVLLRRSWLRAAAWLYPAATVADVLATANHYLLDVITAPGVLLLGYVIASSPALARHVRARVVANGQRRAPAACQADAHGLGADRAQARRPEAQRPGTRRPGAGRPDAGRRAA